MSIAGACHPTPDSDGPLGQDVRATAGGVTWWPPPAAGCIAHCSGRRWSGHPTAVTVLQASLIVLQASLIEEPVWCPAVTTVRDDACRRPGDQRQGDVGRPEVAVGLLHL